MEPLARSFRSAAFVLAIVAVGKPCSAEPAGASATVTAHSPNPAAKPAQDVFWEATRAYHEGNYGRAAELFEQLYAVVPESEVVFNIALARAKSGQCGQAKARFAEYAAQVSDTTVREQATAKFADAIEACREPGAQVIGAEEAVAAPPQHTEPPRTAEIPQWDPTSGAAQGTPLEAVPPSGEGVTGWVLLGAAAGAAGAAIYFETERQEARSNAMHAVTTHEYRVFHADYGHARTLELVSLGAAVGLAAVGVTLLFYEADNDGSLALELGTDRAAKAAVSGSVRLTGSF